MLHLVIMGKAHLSWVHYLKVYMLLDIPHISEYGVKYSYECDNISCFIRIIILH